MISSKKPGKTKAFFICLFIASFLWLIHALNTVYTETFRLDVNFINVPINRAAIDPLPDRISVDIKASGLKLALIMMNKPFKKLDIDFNNLKALNRNQSYVLSASGLNLIDIFKLETQIKHISPDTLFFKEKTGFQKTVPVKVPLYVSCAMGYACDAPIIQPAFVSIWGDSTIVKATDTIYTAALQMSQLRSNLQKSLALIKTHANLYTSTNEVTVELPVAKLIEHRVSLPIQSIHQYSGEKLNIFPPRVQVRFTAAQNKFELTDTALFKAMIDENKPKKGKNKWPVFLGSQPGNITVMSIEPNEVEVLIFKK